MAKKGFVKVVVDLFLAIVFGLLVLQIGLWTFLFYCIAFFSAFFNGLFVRKNNMSWLLFIGTLLTYLASLLLPKLIDEYNAGDVIGVQIFSVLILIIWIKGRNLKRGR